MIDATTLPLHGSDPGPSWVARSDRGYEVISYEGCAQGFQSGDFLQTVQRSMREMGLENRRGGRALTTTEGQEHAQLRRAVAPWFTPRQVQSLRERTVELVRDLVAGVADGDDFMTQVATPVPGVVFCWMMGAPVDWAPRLVDLSFVLLQAFEGDPSKADAIRDAGRELATMVGELADDKRAHPDDGLMSVLIAAAQAGDIEEADVRSLAFELLSASTDNTVNSAGIAMNLLAEHPDQWALLQRTPELAASAVEESLRIDPRVRVEHIFNPEPASLLDVEFPANSDLHLDLVAAHHDPSVYPDPDRFDIARQHARPQLNFGTGRHFCLGAALARMELEVVVQSAVAAWPTLAPTRPPAITRGESATVHELCLSFAN